MIDTVEIEAPKYSLQEKVFHISGQMGTITDANYSLLYDRWQYKIVFDAELAIWYGEEELKYNQ